MLFTTPKSTRLIHRGVRSTFWRETGSRPCALSSLSHSHKPFPQVSSTTIYLDSEPASFWRKDVDVNTLMVMLSELVTRTPLDQYSKILNETLEAFRVTFLEGETLGSDYVDLLNSEANEGATARLAAWGERYNLWQATGAERNKRTDHLRLHRPAQKALLPLHHSLCALMECINVRQTTQFNAFLRHDRGDWTGASQAKRKFDHAIEVTVHSLQTCIDRLQTLEDEHSELLASLKLPCWLYDMTSDS